MKIDIGLVWAKCMNIWAQVSVLVSIMQFTSTMVILYTVTINPNYGIPFWLYALVLFMAISTVITFVITKGISGYYRFFTQQSNLARIEKKLDEFIKRYDDKQDETL